MWASPSFSATFKDFLSLYSQFSLSILQFLCGKTSEGELETIVWLVAAFGSGLIWIQPNNRLRKWRRMWEFSVLISTSLLRTFNRWGSLTLNWFLPLFLPLLSGCFWIVFLVVFVFEEIREVEVAFPACFLSFSSICFFWISCFWK